MSRTLDASRHRGRLRVRVPAAYAQLRDRVLEQDSLVVGTARTGNLDIDAHPLGVTAPTVHESLTPNSFPGKIYPDGLDVPQPGCWVFTLSWAGQRAELELQYC